MKIYNIIIALTLVALGSLSMSAQSQQAIISKVNQVAASTQSMQCDFTQTKYLKLLNDKMVSTGKMYYQKSDKLHWEYMSPYKYTFILNGAKVLLRNNNRNDVIDVKQNKMFQEIARIMMNSVTGNCLNDSKDFKVSVTSAPNEWIATLLPQSKNMRQMFSKIILRFNPQKSIVSTVELWEKNGDHTVIQLKNVITNKPINASVFAVN